MAIHLETIGLLAKTPVEGAQGCGLLGVGILADLGGRDSYLGRRWAQGAAMLGVGILLDASGDDIYRGGEYVQGAALWGIALAADAAGDDRYEALRCAQAFAMPGGLALLLDAAGDDGYHCKGRYPTNYEDAYFDSFSQGCASGFRMAGASGGIALLADLSGADRYEAGHFSQGGGYYFGWGLLHDGGGDDRYLGSRYAQGFAAHEAMGYFEDVAGNDHYLCRQLAAWGISWDESVTAFLDRAGDDVYDGPQGAPAYTAHNAFSLFVDAGGDDAYGRHPEGPALSGPNDYHGGASLSVFIDAGGGKDRYVSGRFRDNLVLHRPCHGLFLDLPGPVAGADWGALKPR